MVLRQRPDEEVRPRRGGFLGVLRLLARLGKRPLLDLDMRLGEASGAVLAVAVVKAAAECHAGMATFEQAGVTDKT